MLGCSSAELCGGERLYLQFSDIEYLIVLIHPDLHRLNSVAQGLLVLKDRIGLLLNPLLCIPINLISRSRTIADLKAQFTEGEGPLMNWLARSHSLRPISNGGLKTT